MLEASAAIAAAAQLLLTAVGHFEIAVPVALVAAADGAHTPRAGRRAVGHRAGAGSARAAVVGIVRCVNLAAVAVRAVAVAVAVGKVSLARRHHAQAAVAAARCGLRDNAGAATVGVAAKVWVCPGNAHAVTRLVIRWAAFLQAFGTHHERTSVQPTQQPRAKRAGPALEPWLPGPPS